MLTISSIIGWIVFGIIVGLIARMLMPGKQPMGWIATMILGIVGSFAGGFITSMVTGRENQPANWIMSIVGALIVLFIAGMASSRKAV